MDIAEQLRVLEAAQGDPAKQALATVDLAFPTLADAERTVLKAALEAAAIPHWCDAGILAALLEISPEDSGGLLTRLRKLTVVEPFPARGADAVNVHEASRLAIRSRLAAERPDRFRTLSGWAASLFATVPTAAGRIEWIYHRLCAAPDEAATELERLDRQWSGTAHPEERQALALALRELAEANLVHGRARVWVSLCIAWSRVARGETAQLGDEARGILDLAAETGDARAVGDAQCLIGDVFQSARQAERGPGGVWGVSGDHPPACRAGPEQRGLATGVGGGAQPGGRRAGAQGKLSEAQAAFGESLAISRRLAEQDPSNAGWQRDLAVAHSRVGGVLEAQGKLSEAQAAFGESLAISRRSGRAGPEQRGLATGVWRWRTAGWAACWRRKAS